MDVTHTANECKDTFTFTYTDTLCQRFRVRVVHYEQCLILVCGLVRDFPGALITVRTGNSIDEIHVSYGSAACLYNPVFSRSSKDVRRHVL